MNKILGNLLKEQVRLEKILSTTKLTRETAGVLYCTDRRLREIKSKIRKVNKKIKEGA